MSRNWIHTYFFFHFYRDCHFCTSNISLSVFGICISMYILFFIYLYFPFLKIKWAFICIFPWTRKYISDVDKIDTNCFAEIRRSFWRDSSSIETVVYRCTYYTYGMGTCRSVCTIYKTMTSCKQCLCVQSWRISVLTLYKYLFRNTGLSKIFTKPMLKIKF